MGGERSGSRNGKQAVLGSAGPREWKNLSNPAGATI